MTKVALRGLAQRKLRAFVTGPGDPPRRRVHRGQLRPHGHDQRVVRPASSTRRYRAPTSRSRRAPTGQADGGDLPAVLRRAARSRAPGAGRRAGRGRHLLARPLRRRRRATRSANSFAPEFISSVAPKPFETLTYTEGRPPRTAAEASIDDSTADREGLDDRRHAAASPARRGSSATGSSGSSGWATPPAAASGTAQLTLPEAQRDHRQARRARPDLGQGARRA